MNAEERFSDRVESYTLYRPHYPVEAYDFLLNEKIIRPEHVIADIGCGTGISAKLFLAKGHKVFGVEPNESMLNAAKEFLRRFEDFVPVKAAAEETTLSQHSADAVVCAQAFHWFDKKKAKKEFERILRKEGKIILMWNERRMEGSDFLKVYEDFLVMFGTDYREVDHRQAQDEELLKDFLGRDFVRASFRNFQHLNLEGLKGRVLSASYMPNVGHRDYDFMMYCLKKIFNRYENNGTVTLEYDTKVYAGAV